MEKEKAIADKKILSWCPICKRGYRKPYYRCLNCGWKTLDVSKRDEGLPSGSYKNYPA